MKFSDFKDFFKDNWNILIMVLIVIGILQYLNKGNFFVNFFVILLHITGDIMMIIAFKKYSQNKNKDAVIYIWSSTGFFLAIGWIAVLQSTDGKNWQYFLGTMPFIISNIFQLLDAWDLKGKSLFNYKTTILTSIIVTYIYYKMDLVYNHVWVQILGYSLFPIFLGMVDSPKVYLGRIFAVFVMLIGVLIDIYYQFNINSIIPSTAISSFFITLIAFFGFKRNANEYLKKVDKRNVVIVKILQLLWFTKSPFKRDF